MQNSGGLREPECVHLRRGKIGNCGEEREKWSEVETVKVVVLK
jgi:hypothetical protein